MITGIGVVKVAAVTFAESHEENNHHLEIKVKNKHGGGKTGDLRFLDIYGNYARSLFEKKVVKEGDIITFSYEDKRIQKIDKTTGKPVYKNIWANVKIMDSETPVYKVSTSTPQPASSTAYIEDEIDAETF